MTTSKSEENLVFDYLVLRLIVGCIAFFFPWVVTFLAAQITSSISTSYHTEARDTFVGFLFVIGVLLVAYKGHRPDIHLKDISLTWKWVGGFLNWVTKPWRGKTDFRVWGRKREEDLVSTIGGLAAIFVALCPTACDFCETGPKSIIHYIGATILFSTVVYFCLIAFPRSLKLTLAKDKLNGIFPFLRTALKTVKGVPNKNGVEVAFGKKILRGCIYELCGSLIAVTMLGLIAAQFVLPEVTRVAIHLTFWAEAVALGLFGIAWVTASKFIPFLADESERK
jgi:hypothetical protein